jgi:hypothetical protein
VSRCGFFANAGLVSIATTTKVDKTNFAFSDFICLILPSRPWRLSTRHFASHKRIAVHKIVSLLAGTCGFSEFIVMASSVHFLRCNKRKNEADEFLHHDNRLRNSFGAIA